MLSGGWWEDPGRLDNRAFVNLAAHEAIPVVVASDDAQFVATVGRWLDACPRIVWETQAASGQAAPMPAILITDQEESAEASASSVLVFGGPRKGARVVLTHWLMQPSHPITTYLQPLAPVAASIDTLTVRGQPGEPVLWGVVGGRKLPLALADTRDGQRRVHIFLNPTATSDSVPMVMLFLNSLRWLSGSRGLITTGQAITVGPFQAGIVRINRPGRAAEQRTHEGGLVRYEATDRSGLYRFTQGAMRIERAVNFFDPVESNTMERASTWEHTTGPPTARLTDRIQRQPLVNWLLALVFAGLLLEWWFYSRRHRAR